jgi:hypothetical protein
MGSITGIVLHDSACPEIKKAGCDFFLRKDGTVLPSNDFLDDDHIHVCIEGDFSEPVENQPLVREQMFVLVKLVLKLSSTFEFDPQQLIAHGDTCPGEEFPWHELKIRIDRPPH